MNFTALFAIAQFASEESGFHIVLKAEELLAIGPFIITNSTLLGWIVAGLMLYVMTRVAKEIKLKPGNRFSQIVEAGVEFVVGTAEGIFHSRAKAVRYAPMLLTLFFFILLNNWAGLMPGVGTIMGRSHGEAAPLLRPFTSDINGTLALAAVTIILVQIYAIRELGVKGHLKHYFSNQPWNPINLFVGVLEVIGEFTRMMSLSLRLFGNVFAGEVLIAVINKISSYGAPITTLPFIFMEFFVGFIQAFVFTMLTIVFLAVATHHEESEEHSSDHGEVPSLAERATS